MNLRRLASTGLLLLQFGAVVLAQAAAPATGLATTTTELAQLPEVRLPIAELRQQIAAHKTEPLRFAVAAAVNLDTRNGSWDAPSPEIARWRLRLTSDGARSLALRLRDVQLPVGAAVWFYDVAGRDVQGPFTSHSAELRLGELHLPLVRSSHAVLELQVPTALRNALAFNIDQAYHGYREFTAASAGTAAPKAAIGSDAGSCNIDVVCVEGDNWRNEIRSTVLLSVDNQTLCSGSLVSNTRLDDRPLILTANHCQIRDNNVTTVTAYFNVQSSSCNGNQDGRTDQNLPGSSFLARDDVSDFTLFTLVSQPLQSPPIPSEFSVFYGGWDARTAVAPQSGVSIHHPQGDEKKISVYNTPGTIANGQRIGTDSDGFTVDAWQITWNRGVTEAGSSGSGLWNQNHQLVGVLSGGEASCSTPKEPDYFARLERAWTANAAASGQLKAHLDPINTGCLQLNSKNPGSAAPLASCIGSVTPGTTPHLGGGSPGLWLLSGLFLAALVRPRKTV